MVKVVCTYTLTEELLQKINQRLGDRVEIIKVKDFDKADQKLLSQAQVLLTNQMEIDQKNLERMENLKWIQCVFSGINHFPLDYLKEKGIILTNARGVHRIQMSEFIVSLLLSIVRRSYHYTKAYMDRKWDPVKIDELYGKTIEEGDLLVGLPSSGLHSNGFSLVRKVLFEKQGMAVDTYVEELGCALGQELIKPTAIYVRQVGRAMELADVKGIAHITGGGFVENIPRSIPSGLKADVYQDGWDVPAVFKYIQRVGNIQEDEMFKTFNMGIGLVIVVSRPHADRLLEGLKSDGAKVIGRISQGTGGVRLWPKRK